MGRILELIRRIIGALGWLLFGFVLMNLEIGPWWAWYIPVTVSLFVIVAALDKALTPKERWPV